MAENNKDIDVLFREKLTEHTERPSQKAWDKIQGRLDQREKKGFLPWMRIAASFLLPGLGLAIIYYSLLSLENDPEMIAQQQAVPDTQIGNIPALEVLPGSINEEIIPINDSTTQLSTAPVKSPIPKANKVPNNRVEKVIKESDVAPGEAIPQMEVESLELPPLESELLMADGDLILEKVEEVPYKITIISNGLRPRQNKDKLVDEIENKIDQIGGLLSKVDQEFSDLQDSKNNLFASLTSRKENNN